MEIYLEFRMTNIESNGFNMGVDQEDKKNSIRWKLKPLFDTMDFEREGAVYDIYPVGTYQAPIANTNLRTIIVKAVHRDSRQIVTTQKGGFIPRDTGAGIIYDIPLHITTDMEMLIPAPPMEGIDNIGPMEGGILAEVDGYLPWIGDQSIIATAVLEHNAVKTLYEYIPFYCNSTEVDTTKSAVKCKNL